MSAPTEEEKAKRRERQARMRIRRAQFAFHLKPTVKRKLDKLASKWRMTRTAALVKLIEEAA